MCLLHGRRQCYHALHGRHMHVRHRRRHMRHGHRRRRPETGTHATDEVHHDVTRSALRTNQGLRSCLRWHEHVQRASRVSGRHYGWRMRRLMRWLRSCHHFARHRRDVRTIVHRNRRARYRVPRRLCLRLRRFVAHPRHLGCGGVFPGVGTMRHGWRVRDGGGVLLHVIRRYHHSDRALLGLVGLQVCDAGRRVGNDDVHLLRRLRVGRNLLLLFARIRA